MNKVIEADFFPRESDPEFSWPGSIPSGDCTTCDSYELRLAELLGLTQRSNGARMRKSSFLGHADDY
jgi:hypothetical protein